MVVYSLPSLLYLSRSCRLPFGMSATVCVAIINTSALSISPSVSLHDAIRKELCCVPDVIKWRTVPGLTEINRLTEIYISISTIERTTELMSPLPQQAAACQHITGGQRRTREDWERERDKEREEEICYQNVWGLLTDVAIQFDSNIAIR